MSRSVTIAPQDLTSEQKQISVQVTKVTGHPPRGPFALWLEIPHIGGPAVQMFEGFRMRGIVDRRLGELMILLVSRRWSVEFAWVTHESYAISHGISAEAVEAIRNNREPELTRDDEKLVYEITTEMCANSKLGAELYDRAIAAMGRPWLLELVACIGFYVMVGMTLNAFEMPPPRGRRPFE
jgi:4-carboxymuconolactone decarboxylase